MNSLESSSTTPEIPINEQIVIWTGFLIGGTTDGRPIDFAELKTDDKEVKILCDVVGASIGIEVSPEDMLRAIDEVSIALQERAIE